MIVSFRNRRTGQLWMGERVKAFSGFEKQARRKLDMLHHARDLADLQVPPANRLESLSGARNGQYSIRINDQWRVCFRFEDGNAFDVEIADYH